MRAAYQGPPGRCSRGTPHRWAAEELVVGGEQLDRAVGTRPHLHAGACQPCLDALLDDAGTGAEVGEVGVDPEDGVSSAIPSTRSRRRSSSSRRRVGQAAQVDDRVAAPETPSFSCDRLEHRGRRRRIPASASTRSSTVWRSSAPAGQRMRAPRRSGGSPSWCRGQEPRVGGVHGDAERQRDVSFEGRRVVGDQVADGRFGIIRRMSRRIRGRTRSLALSDPGVASLSAHGERERAWCGITPGSSPR